MNKTKISLSIFCYICYHFPMCQQDKKSLGVETFPPNDESLALSCRFKNSLQALEFAQRPLITTEKTVKWLNQVSKSINQVLKCASAGFETVPSLCQWQNTKKCLVGHLTDVFSYLTFCLSTAGWKSSLLLRKLTSDQIPIPWTWHLGVPIAIIILHLWQSSTLYLSNLSTIQPLSSPKSAQIRTGPTFCIMK